VNSSSSLRFVATTQSFMADVVQGSSTTPVLVDFWAPWCAPCHQLMPVLERLVTEYAGRFRLAKVNTDEEQALAGQLGIRSLPTVVLFKDGAPVDHFSGVIPEQQIRVFLDRHLPAGNDTPLQRARQLKAQGDFTSARQLLEQHVNDPSAKVELRAELGELQALDGDLDGACSTLDALRSEEPQHPATRRLEAVIAFRNAIVAHPDAGALADTVTRNPKDLPARHALAVHQLLGGDPEPALAAWLAMMRDHPTYDEGLARRSLVRAFDLLGESNPLVASTRRDMAKLLF